jgi:hypothetical protein
MEQKIKTKEIKTDAIERFFDIVSELEELLTDRIADLHNVKGGIQARHAYILYRKLLWEATYLMRDNLRETK